MIIILALSLLTGSVHASPGAPDAAAKKSLSSAIRSYHKLDLQGALAKFDAAISAFPGWKTASGFRAACRSTLGDAAGAREDAELAAKLKPVDALSYAARGKARLTLRDYDGALADFRAAEEADANSLEGPLGVGSVLSAQAKTREALKPLDDAVRLDPQSAAALLMRGSVKDRLRDFHGAADDYGAVLEINPRFVWARLYRGKALRELKDYRGSDADLSAFLDAQPDHEDAAYLRSNVRFLLGDFHGAAADLTTVISLDPRKGLAYVNRGLARVRLGERAGALSDLRKALELDPARRDKIQAAIDSIGSADAGEASAPAPRRAAAEPPPDGPAAVTLESQGSDRAPRRAAAPDADLDDAPPAPKGASPDAPPAKRGPRDTTPERRSGEEGPAFIQ
ncbi:MAG: tetratricopeptide repeat protein [Elusimicrobiota bacterium]